MLSAQTIKVIKSTVPVLEVHGQAITKRFYEMMFSNHPELLNIFNHAHQKQGRQQTALANSVYAAAKHIDELEKILPVVKQIGHKHRSLGVKAEHYPIVGEHLLMAIKDVLGDAATEEIIQAWAEAYGVIAQVFIDVEKEMYEETEHQEGGWAEFRTFFVDKKVQESKVITSFYLKPRDGQMVSSFLPGQYISVKIKDSNDEYTHIRQYSLSDSPGKSHYRISVKREQGKDLPDGKVSNYLHDQINEGDTLEISAPAGDFTLDMSSRLPVVLISGGVGITPMMSMLQTLVESQSEREVTFIHAAINGDYHAMRDDVENLAVDHKNVKSFFCYEAPTEKDRVDGKFDKEGYIDLAWLKEILPSNEADFYFCGPLPFMKAIRQALLDWNVPQENIHFEFFGPAVDLDQA
ncbi:NO-inducible flavohemoprotein [Caldalkalibacillus mannanilyticus]|uniref:NO-inducible flavohemoprotein n=1 Tax=Caldalkalibacillus mannanilyticus TaxID=1418 RepID=UPI0004688A51|nr:NO-inducible flavohemoprotein [Caldalkalibacillus mannanilyticus]